MQPSRIAWRECGVCGLIPALVPFVAPHRDPAEPARVVLWPTCPTLPRGSHPPTKRRFAQVVALPPDLLAALLRAGGIKGCAGCRFFSSPLSPSAHYGSLERLVQHPFRNHHR
ncbi:hypothetical protein L1887_50675 [Cichorium endivia]|nr:hypothetical protein L1887_50675 [Cichorium endivia]